MKGGEGGEGGVTDAPLKKLTRVIRTSLIILTTGASTKVCCVKLRPNREKKNLLTLTRTFPGRKLLLADAQCLRGKWQGRACAIRFAAVVSYVVGFKDFAVDSFAHIVRQSSEQYAKQITQRE